jgi:isopenicillin N synthase-like dioxygenase
VLRYPGTLNPYDAATEGPNGFPPHKDALSIAILFTWLGGLQIPDPNAEVEGLAVKPEDWRWVRPEPGYAVVNLGDAMEIFTKKLLKSGIHRVVKAPGVQRPHDRMSVLIATRPENNALMKPIQKSNTDTTESEKQENGENPVMTSLEWGNSIVRAIQKRVQEEANSRGTSILANG